MHEDSEIRRLLGDTVGKAVMESMPGLATAATAFSEREWDAQASPPADPVERRFGPVRLIVPRSWAMQPEDPRQLRWLVEERAAVSLAAMAGSRSTPSLEEYLEQRGPLTQDGYYRFGAATLTHPSGFACCELAEIVPHQRLRPTRFLRMMRIRRAIVVFKVDIEGAMPPSIGATFAAAFRTIRVD